MDFPTYFTPPNYSSRLPNLPQIYPMNWSGDGQVGYVRCQGCTTQLRFIGNAAAVRCARCGHVTRAPFTQHQRPTPPPRQQPAQAQLVCSNINCGLLLSYPAGAHQVQCSTCRITSVARPPEAVAQIVCSGCQVTLRYTAGAASVRCAVCSCVTRTSAVSFAPAHRNELRLPIQTVVVENPGSDIAIGVARG